MDTRILANNAAELYSKAASNYGDLPVFATRKKALEWTAVSFKSLYEEGLNLASGLIDLGVKARDHIGIFGDNRYEWILCDYAVQFCGAADVPRGRDITDDEILYIVSHANIEVVFVETSTLQIRLLKLRDQLPKLREIILLDPEAEAAPAVLKLQDVIDKGKKLRESGDRKPEERIAGIQADDVFTLIYTSGTTGKPKGAMITHQNIMSQMEVIPISLSFTDRILSILPVWHVLERVIELFSISCGACTYYTSIKSLREDLVNVEPSFMGSAPRLWETLYQRIKDKVRKSHPVRQALFHIAYFLGYHYHDSIFHLKGNKLRLDASYRWKEALLYPLNILRWILVLPWYGFFNVTVLEQIRLSVGGSLKATISGGGALPLEIDEFFNYIGVTVLEGYGLTETSPVVSVRTEAKTVIGTVGPPVAKTEIRIIEAESGKQLYPDKNDKYLGRGKQGEIWVKGPQVMKAYYKEAELTKKCIIDGWLRTGDLGMITFNDCLKIVGRIKSTIVLFNGENVEPEPIEMSLNQSPYIDFSMIVGQDEKSLCALIVINPDELISAGIESGDMEKLSDDSQAKEIIRNEIRKRVNESKQFKRFEKLVDFKILPEEFTVGEELTNLYKVKRHIIRKKYRPLILSMYEKDKINA
jgi:long-chain acyl-CoA synthetase